MKENKKMKHLNVEGNGGGGKKEEEITLKPIGMT